MASPLLLQVESIYVADSPKNILHLVGRSIIMDKDSYDEILQKAKAELTTEQQKRLGETLCELAKNRMSNSGHSVMELKGLGKEIWSSVNADSLVDRERDSWNG